MIPVKTLQPVRSKAYVTYGLIALNGLIFLWLFFQPPAELRQTFYSLAIVPCDITRSFFSFETVIDILRGMFFHGSWAHLAGNMGFLWIFGRNVEEYYGWKKYLLIYFGTGFIAALTHTMIYPNMCVPLVGASGAISGILGSYLLLWPGSRVQTMIVWFRFFPRFYKIPALAMLGYWFIVNLLSGIAALSVPTIGGVAFLAHVGGFVSGLIITFFYLMFNKPPDRTVYLD
ncbi:MAG TPA: rhomboid family intramembrane serine protease [Phototrophicaceae bacterium]|nr:rhomboid family intramembrane serine protease [Phototrophicaceae bacterium]